MKKMLIMAMAVFALVACKKSSSDTGLPKGEAKALEATTTGAVKLLGDTPDEVETALTKAGYKEIKGGYNPFEDMDKAPARFVKKAKALKESSEYVVTYQYGLPDNWETMTEEQAIAWANNAIEDGKSVMLVTATFESKRLNVMATMFVIKKSDKANKTFTGTSTDLYNKLSKQYEWGGSIYSISAGDATGAEQFSDHSKFVSRVSKAEGIEAVESGVAIKNNDAWFYYNMWLNPDASLEKEMLEEGLSTPICYGAYEVGSYDGEDGDY